MNITEIAAEVAAPMSRELDRLVSREVETPSGSWPGSVQRYENRRLRAAIAMALIGTTDERLHDLILAYTRAADRVDDCMVNLTEGKAYAADDALDELLSQSSEIMTALSDDLASYTERLEGVEA